MCHMNAFLQCILLCICLLCISQLVVSSFPGVNSTCEQFMDNSIPASTTWCSYQNPFASRQRTVVDNRLLSDLPSQQHCQSGHCTSVVSVRTSQCNSTVIVFALVDGSIAHYDTLTHSTEVVYRPFSSNRTEEERLIAAEVFDCGHVVLLSETPDDFRLYSSIHDEYSRSFNKSEFQRIAEVSVFETNQVRYVAVQLVRSDGSNEIHFIDSYSIDLESAAIWKLTSRREDADMRFQHVAHYRGFGKKYMVFRSEADDPAVNRSDIIVLSDQKHVRMVTFRAQSLVVDMGDLSNKTSIFFTSEADQIITAVGVFADAIRRPTNHAPIHELTCLSVEYQPSQSIYLIIGVNTSGINSIHYQLIREFGFLTSTNDTAWNPANRADPFPCNPDQYLESGECHQAISWRERIEKEVTSFGSAFIDIPSVLNNIGSSKSFDPETVCQMAGNLSPLFPLDECKNIAKNVSCEIDLFNGGIRDQKLLRLLFSTYWQTEVFAVHKNNIISVWSHSLWLSSDFGEFRITSTNTLESPGNIIDLYISPNGQYTFTTVQRAEYEIEALDRFNEICNKLTGDADNIFLKPYDALCDNFPYEKMQLGDYTLLGTNCPDYVYCPSFNETVILSNILPGIFIQRPFEITPCLPGYYCLNGVALSCPIGMQCNSKTFSVTAKPGECSIREKKNGFSCYHEGLIAPIDVLPAGMISSAMSLRPIPVPPGRFLKAAKLNDSYSIAGLEKCNSGDYCALARVVISGDSSYQKTSLECPALTHCSSSDVLLPEYCIPNDTMILCPQGTAEPVVCPAGYYCSTLQNKTECYPREYCPAGSYSSRVCEAGYYCPNTTVQLACPRGNYCPEGSMRPIPCSWFFSFCKEKSQHDALTPAGIAILIVILAGIMLVSVIYSIYSHYLRHNREKQRQLSTQSPVRYNFEINNEDNFDIVEHETELFEVNTEVLSPTASLHLERPDFYMDIKFHDLGLRVRSTGQRVLRGVTGEIHHGQLTCILGPSGCGKSSFLTTLAGRAYYGTAIGEVYINNQKVNIKKYNRVLGFVRQDDIMIPSMTVEETLYFAARTRLDWRVPRSDVMKVVDNVIEVLKLSHIRHSIIGDEETRGISGGQRKRVNVGIELVSQPVALLCDEPTSGLDSASSMELCEALKNISQSGVNVIAVIHQPRYEIFQSFEQVMLLGLEGRTVYLGPVNEVEQYFEKLGYVFPAKVNPADHLLDIVSGISKPQNKSMVDPEVTQVTPEHLPEIWENYCKTRVQSEEETSDTSQELTPMYQRPEFSKLVQWYMCVKRASVQQLRSIPSILLDLLLVWIGGLIIALSFRDKSYVGPMPNQMQNLCPESMRALCSVPLHDPLVSIAMMINLALSMTGAMSALRCFGRERLVFNKESESGLSTIGYFLAKDIAMIPTTILSPLVFLVVFYSIQNPRANIAWYYLLALLIYWTSYGLGYLVSVVFKPHLSQLAAVVMVIILFSQSGVTPTLPDYEKMVFPLNLVPYFSYLFYAQQAIYLTEIKKYDDLYDIEKSLGIYGYKTSNLLMCICCVFAYGVLFRGIALFALICSKPSSRFFQSMATLNNWSLKLKYIVVGKVRAVSTLDKLF